MYSGIMERIKKINKLSYEEKQELKESVKYQSDSIYKFMQENPALPIAVRNALEDRRIMLSDAYFKCE